MALKKPTTPESSSPKSQGKTDTSSRSSGCCMGTSSCSSPSKSGSSRDASSTSLLSFDSHKKGKTRIVVKYDVGFNNQLFVRGKGANLSWERGILLKNVKNDEWIWETDMPVTNGEFKVLINDQNYEAGENHPLKSGMTMEYTPRF